MHLIDALSWAHANCLLLPVFDTKFCAVILGLPSAESLSTHANVT